ncbi:DNA-damage-repair/toleration protein DRT100 [Apostasia shenzhenica]|uniref:DNA-damage-repair/toleration protein DRT100 n=1 Tax=Apostasia shenzhenica TaxID=1088818 RepID=A0A2I0AKX7_9ASPA|nr:DNA-damage-repair/toleration protein DRT100 [Apostasia shenzhenica]
MVPLLLLLLLLLAFPLHASSSTHIPTLSPGDRQALLDIRQSLHDLPGSTFFSSWVISSGDTANPCSTFAGVFCSLDDEAHPLFLRVSALTLGTGLSDSPGLGGSLPPSIANLTALTELVVFPGRVSGPIPLELGSTFPRLRLLSISGNRILGPIPPSLSGLPFLHTLDLSQNQLQGPLPAAILASNPSLKVLILASNGGLCGDLPPELSSSVALLHLDLRDNSFTGSLPPLPPSIRYLSVSLNSMSGHLSPAFAGANIPSLQFLDLSGNSFDGALPPAIFAFPQLSSIFLQRNNLSGPLPLHRPPSSSPPWAVVDLSHNMLTGGAPAWLAGAKNLYLNDNQLRGSLPADFISGIYNGSMITLYAQRNFLSSFSLPPPADPPEVPSSASLCLSYNCVAPPAAVVSGCPIGSRARQPRPADQCAGGVTRAGHG